MSGRLSGGWDSGQLVKPNELGVAAGLGMVSALQPFSTSLMCSLLTAGFSVSSEVFPFLSERCREAVEHLGAESRAQTALGFSISLAGFGRADVLRG